MIDLHVHTNFSDGQHAPGELFRMAAARGIETLAFADHMTSAAVSAGYALASRYKIEFFSGVEFSTRYQEREYHLLLYGFNPSDEVLEGFLDAWRQKLWAQAARLVDELRQQGFDLSLDDFAGWAKAVPAGTNFLDALKQRNVQDARLAEYLTGSKSYAPYLSFHRDYLAGQLTPAMPELIETIELFRDKGVVILAHPGRAEASFLSVLHQHGLHGIEVYSTYHDAAMCDALLEKARALNLLASAGSDFHGESIKPGIRIGDVQGLPDASLLETLRKKCF